MNIDNHSNRTNEYLKTLLSAALRLSDAGITVIPARDKKPLISSWQHQHHSTQDKAFFDDYFTGKAHQVAILCGAASGGLACIDIDDEDAHAQFLTRIPHLTHTRYETSPRGHHYYVSVPQALHPFMQALHAPSLDIIWKGYVIAAPSEGYRLEDDSAPVSITMDDIAALMQWVSERKEQGRVRRATPSATPATKPRIPTRRETGRLGTLYSLYTERTQSRNTGLFFAATWARDHHISAATVRNHLQEAFIQHAPLRHTDNESDKQRRDEFERTLTSAYSQPARPAVADFQLTDRIREALAQRKMTYLWRTLDALYSQGFKPQQTISRDDAREALAGIVGRDSIYAALEATNNEGVPLFSGTIEKAPPQTPPKNYGVATIRDEKIQVNPCVIVGVSKSVKRLKEDTGGRPKRLYILPNMRQIRAWLNLKGKYKAVSYISLEDLASNRTTRARLHESLILRRAGQYHRRWLADRVGVSITTIRRYDRQRGVNVVKQYAQHALSIDNVSSHLTAVNHRGWFLMDERGQKYPALSELAEELIMKGKSLILWEQRANFYEITPPARPRQLPRKAQTPERRQPLPPIALWEGERQPPAPATSSDHEPTNLEKLSDAVPRLPATIYQTKDYHRRGRYGWLNKYSPDDEQSGFITGKYKREDAQVNQLVQTEIDNIQALMPSLARKTILKLLDTYGYKQVHRQATHVLDRDNVQNPAGLLHVILRSEYKFRKVKPS